MTEPQSNEQIQQWLDEADALLAQEPQSGEWITIVQERAITAQWLITRAQSALTRRQLLLQETQP